MTTSEQAQAQHDPAASAEVVTSPVSISAAVELDSNASLQTDRTDRTDASTPNTQAAWAVAPEPEPEPERAVQTSEVRAVYRSPIDTRILVFGIIPSLTWSVTRCLSRQGYHPVVLGWHRVSPLQALRECTYVPLRGVRWVDGELEPQLLDQVEAACRAHDIDVVLPVDFPGVQLFARHASRVESARVAAVPDAELMNTLHNKWRFSQIIGELGIPQPATELAQTESDLRATRLTFPIITKPVDRWASVGFQIHRTLPELQDAITKRTLSADFPLLVQEFIPGKDVGFGFLARHGELLAHTAFEQPRKGVRRYYEANALREHVAKLIKATGYHGVGEIDTRYDPSRDEYRVLEINPRFWASLLYAQHAGMNFPELLARMVEVGAGPGFTATTRPVSLDYYELGVAKAVQLSERAYALKERFLG